MSPVEPGFARFRVDWDLGSKLYSPHAPTSQYIVRMAQGTNSLKLLLLLLLLIHLLIYS